MINEIIEFFSALPTYINVIIAILFIGMILSLFKKFIKFAIYLAVFAILLIVIYKLVML